MIASFIYHKSLSTYHRKVIFQNWILSFFKRMFTVKGICFTGVLITCLKNNCSLHYLLHQNYIRSCALSQQKYNQGEGAYFKSTF